MGLRRKHSRRIVVDGERYRWTVGTSQQARTGCVSVVLELAAEPRQRLVVQVPRRNFWLDFKELGEGSLPYVEEAYRLVTPGIIRSIVVSALAAGWEPREKHKPLTLSWTQCGLGPES